MSGDLRNLTPGRYDDLREAFEWEVPGTVNTAVEICDRHADDRGRMALYWEDDEGTALSYTFHELAALSNRCANAFRDRGVGRGDVVAIFLPNDPEFVIATLAGHKLGAINMPLYHLFGPDGLSYRLEDADPELIVTDPSGLEKLERADGVPDEVVVVTDGHVPASPLSPTGFDDLLSGADREFDPVETAPDDPAQLFYTSGTTGDPKGVVQAHRYVVGHRHIGQYMRDFTPSDRIWHAGNLAWAGGFANLIEAWSIGAPVLKYKGRFDSERTLSLIEAYGIDVFVSAPTAIRRMMDLDPAIVDSYDVDLRVVASGGERVTVDILEWIEETLGAFAVSSWGQTECYGVGWPPLGDNRAEKLGTIGKPLPGFDAAVLDEEGEELPDGEVGELAIRHEDNPTMFLEYYGDPEATAAVREGPWHRTGDSVYRDADGYYWFQGRSDDIIISSGYRLSPTEIETALNRHPAVKEAAVIGVPDEERTNVARAYVEVAAGSDPSDELAGEIREFVKSELARFEYPREIEFVEELPKTITGKIQRGKLRDRALGGCDG